MIGVGGAPSVLEYNCRGGDPDRQTIMMRFQSDLVTLCEAAVDGTLVAQGAAWTEAVCVGVVMAAGGYPDSYSKGHVISGLDRANRSETRVFHAGTDMNDGKVVTAGGRVLCVCAMADSVLDAATAAYSGCDEIHWDGAFFRPDKIGRAHV